MKTSHMMRAFLVAMAAMGSAGPMTGEDRERALRPTPMSPGTPGGQPPRDPTTDRVLARDLEDRRRRGLPLRQAPPGSEGARKAEEKRERGAARNLRLQRGA